MLALLAGLVISRDTPSYGRERAGLILWGGWLIVTMVVFSFMSGTVHPYYAVALAPAIGALVAIGGRQLWQRRRSHLGPWRTRADDRGHRRLGLVPDGPGRLRLAELAGLDDSSSAAYSAHSCWRSQPARLKRFAVAAALVGSIAAIGGSAGFTRGDRRDRAQRLHPDGRTVHPRQR